MKKENLLIKLKKKFGLNRAVLNPRDPGNDKYKRSHVKIVQK
jgi:hypothetical protein